MDRCKEFTSLILKINRRVQKLKSVEMKQYNVKGCEVMCIYHIYNNNNITSKELVKLCEEDKAQISRSLQELEKKGIIQFVQLNDKKRYNTIIVLTEYGFEVANAIQQKVDYVFSICGAVLKDDEREMFYDSLQKIATSLDEYQVRHKEYNK